MATLTSAGPRLGSSVTARRPRPDPLRCAPLLEAWAGRGGRPPRCPGPRARVRERVRGAQQLRRASPAHAPPVRLTTPTQLRPSNGSAQVPPPLMLSTIHMLRPDLGTRPSHHAHSTGLHPGPASSGAYHHSVFTIFPAPFSLPMLHSLYMTPPLAPPLNCPL